MKLADTLKQRYSTKVFDLDKKLNMPNLNSRKIPTTATDACNAILAS